MRPTQTTERLLPGEIFNSVLRPVEIEPGEPHLLAITPHLDSTLTIDLAAAENSFYKEATRGHPKIILDEKPLTITEDDTDAQIAAKTAINANRKVAEAIYEATGGTQEFHSLSYAIFAQPLMMIQEVLATITPPPNTESELRISTGENNSVTYSSSTDFSTTITPADSEPRIKADFSGNITLKATLNVEKKRFELTELSFSGTPLFRKYVRWFATQNIGINSVEHHNQHKAKVADRTRSDPHYPKRLNFAEKFFKFMRKEDNALFNELIKVRANELLSTRIERIEFHLLAYDYEALRCLLKFSNQASTTQEQRIKILEITTNFLIKFSEKLNHEQKKTFCKEAILLCQHFKKESKERKLAEKFALVSLGFFKSPTEVFDFKHAYHNLSRSAKISAGVFIALFVAGVGVATASFFIPFLPVITIGGFLSLNIALLILCASMAAITAVGHLIDIHRVQMKALQQSLAVLENVAKEPIIERKLSNAASPAPSVVVQQEAVVAPTPGTLGTVTEDASLEAPAEESDQSTQALGK